MTTTRSISSSNQSIRATVADERLPTSSLPYTTNQSTNAPTSPHSANRASADRSSEMRLRSTTPAPPLTLLDLPNELLQEKIDRMKIRTIVKLSETNQLFYQLTASIRKDYANAHASIRRVKSLTQHSSNPPALAGADNINTGLASSSSPRSVEFNSILAVANQIHHAKPKTMVLLPLAEKLVSLSPGQQTVNAFYDVSVAAGTLPAAWHVQVLTTLARIFDNLPQGLSRLDAVNGLLTTVHTLPSEHRAMVLVILARKLNALEEDQSIIDVANRIIAEIAQLPASDNEMVLKQLVGIVRTLPWDQLRFDLFRTTLAAVAELPADHRESILALLAKNVGELPDGHARTLAFNEVLYATAHYLPAKNRCAVLQPLAENIEHLDEGPPRTEALNAILQASSELPIWHRCQVLKELAVNLGLIEEGQPIVDALNSILEAVRQTPADQKVDVLLPLAFSAHALPEIESIDAFRRVMGEAATMDGESILFLLANFLANEGGFERTPRQMIGELNPLIELTAALLPSERGSVLISLTANSGYRSNLREGHSIDALSQILAMTTNDMPEFIRRFVILNLGGWVANLAEGQMIEAALNLVAQIENKISNNKKASVLNTITNPNLFIGVLPKGQVASVFAAMLNAVVKLDPNEKEKSLTNLAVSIELLPDAAKLDAFKSVAEATGDMLLDESALSVLIDLLSQIDFIPEIFKSDAYRAHAAQAAKRSSNFDFYL